MSTSRREFLGGAAAAAGAALTSSCTAQSTTQSDAANTAASGCDPAKSKPLSQGVAGSIPATMPMGSGAPLGGIGTGFVEIRADGCFYEWQIFNSGPWAQNAPSTTSMPTHGAQYLRFLIRTQKSSERLSQIRRLYLRSDENDLYTYPYLQDIDSIDYTSTFPMTNLRYNDETLPVRASARAFSPFIPGRARDSATPGFHVVFTLENTSQETVSVSLSGFLDNPLASALPERQLTNSISQDKDTTSLFLKTDAQANFPSGIGSMCFSVTGGEHSYVAGTFQEYALPGKVHWTTPRTSRMLLDALDELSQKGRLPDSNGSTDPSATLLTDAQIEALSDAELQVEVDALSKDALLARIFNDARDADPATFAKARKDLLKEIRKNLLDNDRGKRLTWGTGVLASSVSLAPGQKVDVRFTVSWFFPHHLTAQGRSMGHMYANWFNDAADVNRYLCTNYETHLAGTSTFARTLADTSLGESMAFAWASQLSTTVFNTWWTKDDSYAIWEGLGCCGLSTTDVDYQGSFPVVALFPELKLGQMKHIIASQNSLGQVPHNYDGDVNAVDNGFARVDMNSQFVMMVCRDYLWTADKEYLESMWPHVVRAMAFTQSLDTNGDALPDRDTGLQSYDQWRMRGTPSYIASLWIGALRAGIRIADDAGKPEDAQRWSDLLSKASESFDRLLFNGQYYSLWVDGSERDELCMTDQISGEWFSHLIGLPTTISTKNLNQSTESIFKNNFNKEFGLHNATAPRGGLGLLTLTNLQAGGVWSGVEYAFASFLMDHGRYTDGVKIVEAIHQRYLRAGQPWNHVECGGHYSRAMSSWATLLAATGFKPDLPNETLTMIPTVPGDFRAPWVTSSGFGTICRTGRSLSISCAYGELRFASLKLDVAEPRARLGNEALSARTTVKDSLTTMKFNVPIVLRADRVLTIA